MPDANTKWRPLTMPVSIRRGSKSSAIRSRCSVASTTSFGMPSIRQKTFVAPPGRQVSGVSDPIRPLAASFIGAVAAERDDHVVALGGRLAAEVGGVALRLGVDRLDGVAALERVHDEVLQPVGDRRRIRVHDHEHPLLGAALGKDSVGQLFSALERGIRGVRHCP